MSSIFGKGIAFPPRLDAFGRWAWSDGESNIRESIAVILKTAQRERIALAHFGAGLQRFLFEPNISETHAQIGHEIETALRKFEPRIALQDVEVAADAKSASTAVATITYRLVASGATERMSVNIALGGQG